MLAVLLETPQTPDEWSRFAFHNNDQITLINQAILNQYGVALAPYILFPLNLEFPTNWLFANQAAHTQINQVLQLQSHDIQDLDFTDPDQVAAWINTNYFELFDASAVVGV